MKTQVTKAIDERLADKSTWPKEFNDLRLRKGVLETPVGPIPLTKLGKGAFSTAYKAPDDRVFVLTQDGTYDKEIAESAHGDRPTNPHLPAVERFGMTAKETVYTMPFYNAPLRASNKEAWAEAKKLRACRDKSLYGNKAHMSGYERNVATTECAVESGVPEPITDALEALTSTASNYSTDYLFEFPNKNLATDALGRLVLLDVLFDEAEMRKRRNAKTRAYRGW